MHRTDPDRDGYVMCGRVVDPHAAVHSRNPGFDPCIECATLLGEPVNGGVRSQATDRPANGANRKPRRESRPPVPRPASPLPRPPVPRPPAAEDEPAEIKDALAKTGWVRLPGRLLHDPVIR
ncbi:hypothetical protein Adu01nite_94130 [Paractinoplanes durhamensis]|uniref:Uncharacterized protein n=2 Tax=Paractinoplanes durhamensis TaxID=113563 RepID=A0ABQ3ZDZ4_9ACTN|nr:hypothetical protein Adu01nite_94130 [Actinoplanes durhamensis]